MRVYLLWSSIHYIDGQNEFGDLTAWSNNIYVNRNNPIYESVLEYLLEFVIYC